MKIIVKNNPKVSNKYIRLLKWKLYGLKEKFKDLLYAEAFLDAEGQQPKIYSLKIRLGLKGHDAIIKNKHEQLDSLVYASTKNAHQVLNKKLTKYSVH